MTTQHDINRSQQPPATLPSAGSAATVTACRERRLLLTLTCPQAIVCSCKQKGVCHVDAYASHAGGEGLPWAPAGR